MFTHAQRIVVTGTSRHRFRFKSFAMTSQKMQSDAILVDFQNKNGQRSEDDRVFALLRKIRRSRERKVQKSRIDVRV